MSTDTKRYAVETNGIDFGTLNARNQLISKVIGPALDTMELDFRHDHIVGSKTHYTVVVMIKAEREIESIQ